MQSLYAGLDDEARAAVDAMLAACGMTGVLTARLDRRIGRADNLEVWEA